MNLIEYKNIYKAFGPKKILVNMNLKVKEGETYTIIGGSGTGKSISLKLLLQLLPLDKGEIFFQGRSIVDMPEDELIQMRSLIGMVFQNAALFDSLTVEENVAYPLREHFTYTDEEIKRIVKQKLNLVGLDGSQELYPADLSGGMKKRVGVARAIATNPKVLLYDEPTTGLDPANTNRIGDLILLLQEKLNVTSIVVTHDMEFAFKISDRIGLLYDHHIECEGTVDEIKFSKNPLVQNFINGEIGDIRGGG